MHGELASTTSWQYFGGQETGLFAQYPASIKTQCWCDGYDPRYRPWYAAAVTGPKDFVMVLDVSGSMKTATKTTGEDGEENEANKIIDHENSCQSPARHDHIFRLCTSCRLQQ